MLARSASTQSCFSGEKGIAVPSECLHGNLLMNVRDLTISLHSGRVGGLAGTPCDKCLPMNTSTHEYV